MVAVAELEHLDVVLAEGFVGPLDALVVRYAHLVAVGAGAAVAAGFRVQSVKVHFPFRAGELGAFRGLVGVVLREGAGAFLGVFHEFFLGFFVEGFGSGFRGVGLDSLGSLFGRFGIVFHDFLYGVAVFVELDVFVVKFLVGESDGGGQGEGNKKEIKEIFLHDRDLT